MLPSSEPFFVGVLSMPSAYFSGICMSGAFVFQEYVCLEMMFAFITFCKYHDVLFVIRTVSMLVSYYLFALFAYSGSIMPLSILLVINKLEMVLSVATNSSRR
jgi:hypothetical protein